MPEEPDGYFVAHYGSNFASYFGPFVDLLEAQTWLEEHPDVNRYILPMFKSVNWSRR